MTRYAKPEKLREKVIFKWALLLLCAAGFAAVQWAARVLYQWNDDMTQLRQLRGFSYLFILGAAAAAHIRTRETYVRHYGMDEQALHLDLLDSVHRRIGWKLFLMLGLLFFFFQSDYRFGGIPLAGWVFLLCGLVGLANYAVDLILVKKREYRILEDRVTGKRKDTDSDGVNHFVVVYANEAHGWEKKVSAKAYLDIHLGDTYTAVYLKWRKKPTLCYPVSGE